MSIWTSAWFWILVLGIILTIVGVVIWIVQANANVTVGILLGFGVAWIIAGLIFWIFGRSKAPPTSPTTQSTPVASATKPPLAPPMPQGTVPPMPQTSMPPVQGANPYMTSNSYGGNNAQQQQLQQFLLNNPQYLNAYMNASNAPKI
jgi:hypothetical protein